MAFITIDEVREDMLDRMAEDHLVLPDLAFTDADIAWAMKAAARKFNSTKPLVCTAVWDKLSDSTNMFYDGIAWALLRRWHRNVSMNDFDYDSGGISANVQGSLAKNLERLVAKLEAEFLTAATDYKAAVNIHDAFGPIG